MAEAVEKGKSVLPPAPGDDKEARKKIKEEKKALRKEMLNLTVMMVAAWLRLWLRSL